MKDNYRYCKIATEFYLEGYVGKGKDAELFTSQPLYLEFGVPKDLRLDKVNLVTKGRRVVLPLKRAANKYFIDYMEVK